jgi:hypothetical protein
MNRVQIDALATIDLNIKKLEVALKATDTIHAWLNGLGVFLTDPRSVEAGYSATALWNATPVEQTFSAGCHFVNGHNERTQLTRRAALAEIELEKTRKVRAELARIFNSENVG